MDRERDIERYFTRRLKAYDVRALKFTSANLAGVPDRLIFFRGGRCVFAEIKAPGKRLRPLQAVNKRQWEAFGHTVWVIDSREKVQEFIDYYFGGG